MIDDAPNLAFLETLDHPEGRMRTLRARFEGVRREGALLSENDALADEITTRVASMSGVVGDQFPNTLAQALFRGVGIGAVLRRTGNQNLRMDLLLGPPGVVRGVAEVEFGDQAVLEAPRKVLEHVAVLSSRYGWSTTGLVALVVSDVLPNRRSDYWEIIRDIRSVLGVQVGTVTILALMLVIWNGRRLALEPANVFYVDRDTESYRRQVLSVLLDRPVQFSEALRQSIEVAK